MSNSEKLHIDIPVTLAEVKPEFSTAPFTRPRVVEFKPTF